MQTSYIYSVSRANTLTQFLLSKTDIERLLVASAGEELQTALKETYLAPYLLQVPEENLALAIEQTLIEAKSLIHRIAPDGEMFRVLWMQYNIHNLRVFAKAKAKNLSFADCEPLLSKRGIYDPKTLFEHVESGTLNRLQPGWQEVFDEVVRHVEAGEIDKVDGLFDVEYFKTSSRIATKSGDPFIQKYLKIAIDLYNLKSRLRTLKYPSLNFGSAFVSGGNFGAELIGNEEQVMNRFADYGGESFWQSAIQYLRETGNTTRVDARADEYLLTVAKEASFDMFSSASLVLYYLQCRQAAANVRTIVVGKNSGQSESEIRANLRLAYVNA